MQKLHRQDICTSELVCDDHKQAADPLKPVTDRPHT